MLSNNTSKRQIQIDGINMYVNKLKNSIICSNKLDSKSIELILNIIDNTALILMAEKDDNKSFFSIQEFALQIGVSTSTLRLWDKSGKLHPHHRTAGGHRVYSKEQAVQYYITNNLK